MFCYPCRTLLRPSLVSLVEAPAPAHAHQRASGTHASTSMHPLAQPPNRSCRLLQGALSAAQEAPVRNSTPIAHTTWYAPSAARPPLGRVRAVLGQLCSERAQLSATSLAQAARHAARSAAPLRDPLGCERRSAPGGRSREPTLARQTDKPERLQTATSRSAVWQNHGIASLGAPHASG